MSLREDGEKSNNESILKKLKLFFKNMRRSPLPIVSDEPEFHVPL